MTVAISTAVRCNSPLEKALADIAAAGFKTIDLLAIDGWVHVHTSDLADRYEQTRQRLDVLLQQHGLNLLALNTGVAAQLHHRSPEVNARRKQEISGLVRLMKEYGVRIAAIQPRAPDRARPWEEVLADCAATLREQVEMGAAAGITFALELHVNSPFETLEQAKRLLEVFPELPLVYDPTHFVMQGIPLRETGWLMAHARHVHLRDAAKDRMQVPMGSGEVDFDWLLGTLKERGYQGHVSIEYLETADFAALESARRLYDLVERALS